MNGEHDVADFVAAADQLAAVFRIAGGRQLRKRADFRSGSFRIG
jgi:hypothetical protein